MNVPDQPGQHADDRLRAAAEARRQDAPDFALHPATRRMLVDEARRQHARRAPTQGGPWRVRWIWAWASGLALVATVLVLQPLAKTKARRLAQPAPPAAEAAPVLESLALKEDGLAVATNLHQEPLLALAEAPPALRELSPVGEAAVPAAPPAPPEFLSLAGAQAPGAGGGNLSLGAPVRVAALPAGQRFLRVRTPAERARRDAAPGVLERFTVHAEGGALVLTDSDGSVYRGELSAPSGDGAEAVPHAFRVEGTNLTLRLPVVVTGVIAVAAPSLPRATVAGRGLGEPAASPKPAFLSLRGTSVIGGTNRVEILAAPPRPDSPPAA
ncbi:MAG: hypothetical protein ACKVYV_09620 [Limisphaerales bacterium]